MIKTTNISKQVLKRKFNKLVDTRWVLEHKVVNYLYDGSGFSSHRSFQIHKEALGRVQLEVNRLATLI